MIALTKLVIFCAGEAARHFSFTAMDISADTNSHSVTFDSFMLMIASTATMNSYRHMLGMFSAVLMAPVVPTPVQSVPLPSLDVTFSNTTIDVTFGELKISGPPCLGWYNPAMEVDSSSSANTYFSRMETMSGTFFGNWSISFHQIPRGSHDMNMTLQFNLTTNATVLEAMESIFFIPFGCKHGSEGSGIQWPPHTQLKSGYYNGNNGATAPAVLLIDYGKNAVSATFLVKVIVHGLYPIYLHNLNLDPYHDHS